MDTTLGYSARRLPYLPYRLEDGLSVDYLAESQFSEGYQLIQESATRGDNVGKDEFPNHESFRNLVKYSKCFGVHHLKSKKLAAMVLVRPEVSCRTVDHMVCELRIFLSDRLWRTEPGSLSEIIRLAEKFATDLGLGYVAAVVNVALPCRAWISVLRSQLYVCVAILPKCVTLDNRLVESCKFFKLLHTNMRLKRPLKIIKQITDSKLNDQNYLAHGLPQFACLPKVFQITNGMKALLRNHRHTDDLAMYQLLQQASDSGQGFGSDEIPTLEAFRLWFMMVYRCCIIEDLDDGSLIGFVMNGRSVHSRSQQDIVGENITMLRPSLRGRGMGRELVKLGQGLAKASGCRYILNDSLASNVQVSALVSGNEQLCYVGSLPYGAHVSGVGWVDLMFDFTSLERVLPLKSIGLFALDETTLSKL